MKRFIYLLLLLPVVFAGCADDAFRPGWMVAYPASITDNQGIFSSWDVQTLAYDMFSNQTNLGITVTAEAASTITIGGTSSAGVTLYSNQLILTNGLNRVEVQVARSGYQAMTYTFAVTYIPAAEDTRLSLLQVLPGTIDPAFSQKKFNYTNVLEGDKADLVVDTVQAGASVFIDGTPAAKGVPYAVSGLLPGDNPVAVMVISQDGSKTNTTQVNLHRLQVVSIATIRAEGVTNYSMPRYFYGIAIRSRRGAGSKNAFIQTVGTNVGVVLRGAATFTFRTGDYLRVKYSSTGLYYELLQVNVPADGITILESDRQGDLVYDTVTATPPLTDEGKYVRVQNFAFGSAFNDGANWASPIYFRNESGAAVAPGTYTLFGHVGRYNTTSQILLYDQSIQVFLE